MSDDNNNGYDDSSNFLVRFAMWCLEFVGSLISSFMEWFTK